MNTFATLLSTWSRHPVSLIDQGLRFACLMSLAIVLASCGTDEPQKNRQETPPAVEITSDNVPVDENVKDMAYFLRRMVDLKQYAIHRPNETMIQRSSHRQDGDPSDADVYLKGEYIFNEVVFRPILDEEGPGCITRIWLSNNANGRLLFIFDNESEPRLDVSVQDLFGGPYHDYASFLSLTQEETKCGQVTFIPMPFQKKCTILTSNTNTLFKYQINVLKMKDEPAVKTFEPELDKRTIKALTATQAKLERAAFQDNFSVQKPRVSVVLKPGESKRILNLPGPAAIDYFQIEMNNPTPEQTNNLYLKVFWDDMLEPSVDCTLSDFFYSLNLKQFWGAYPLGFYDTTSPAPDYFFCQYYLPFREKAAFFLENTGDETIELTFAYTIDFNPLPDDFLYFYAKSYKRQFSVGSLYPLFDYEGAGNFVGMRYSTFSEWADEPLFFMEGDEYFYANGEEQASWYGTGLDNYINGDNKLSAVSFFYTPMFGTLGWFRNEKSQTEGGNFFRLHLLDAIPFNTSLMMVQEIGDPAKFIQSKSDKSPQANYKWVCYWYGRPAQKKVERKEALFYYSVTQGEKGAPSLESPVIRNTQLFLKVPAGDYWVHSAPVWNPSAVSHQKMNVSR